MNTRNKLCPTCNKKNKNCTCNKQTEILSEKTIPRKNTRFTIFFLLVIVIILSGALYERIQKNTPKFSSNCPFADSSQLFTDYNHFFTLDTNEYLKLCRSNPELKKFSSDLQKEIPNYFSKLKYLCEDSVKDIEIDFFGMTHGNMHNPTDTGFFECQKVCYDFLEEYDYIGSEELYGDTIIDRNELVRQQIEMFDLMDFRNKIHEDKINSIIEVLKTSKDFKESATFQLIARNKNNVLGVEPKTIKNIENYLLSNFDPRSLHQSTLVGLSYVRSELALAETIAYIRKNKIKNKKVAILFGAGHLAQFEQIANKIHLQRRYCFPDECSIN